MAKQWWGDVTLEEDQLARWDIGPLVFSLRRHGSEWRLQHYRDKDPETDRFSLAQPIDRQLAKGDSLRFHLHDDNAALRIQPLLGDRPFIINTEIPLRVAPSGNINFYITTIMRLGFFNGTVLLAEIPIFDNRDSWFGDFLSGELCYASATLARTKLGTIPTRNYRPVTPVVVQNLSSAVLKLEKFKLPMPNLQLHSDKSGRLFTDSVYLECKNIDRELEIKVNRNSDELLSSAGVVAPPRQLVKESYGIRWQDSKQK